MSLLLLGAALHDD